MEEEGELDSDADAASDASSDEEEGEQGAVAGAEFGRLVDAAQAPQVCASLPHPVHAQAPLCNLQTRHNLSLCDRHQGDNGNTGNASPPMIRCPGRERGSLHHCHHDASPHFKSTLHPPKLLPLPDDDLLGQRYVCWGPQSSDSEEDGEGLDDEAMERLNGGLAAAVRAASQSKPNSSERRQQMLNFKLRCARFCCRPQLTKGMIECIPAPVDVSVMLTMCSICTSSDTDPRAWRYSACQTEIRTELRPQHIAAAGSNLWPASGAGWLRCWRRT